MALEQIDINSESLSATTLSADTIYVGGNLLSTTNAFLPNLTATTFSAGTYFSGFTPLDLIIYSIVTGNSTSTLVQSGLNTYTGGTYQKPTINISAATLAYLSASTISGDTFYSGATPLETIMYNIAVNVGMSGTPGTSTYVQPGLNTYTGGTPLLPTVNISAATLTYLSASTISGDTIYSGNTSLQNLFSPLGFSKLDFQVITSGDTSRLTTTSTTFTNIPGMSATTKNLNTSATTYQVMFTCDASNSINNAQIIIRLRKNGTELSGTTRNVTMGATNQRLILTTIGYATNVSSGDVFNAQWRVNTGTASMTGRTFTILGTKTDNVYS
jgi:hypothetical protein